MLLLIFAAVTTHSAFSWTHFSKPQTLASLRKPRLAVSMASSPGPQLHGTSQSRSPLVNWFALEAGISLQMQPARPSNHPFDQVPFLTDDSGEVEIFESGAILLYLADRYGNPSSSDAVTRAKYTKWVVWAGAELDGLCFGAIPGDHRVRGTSMDNPSIKQVAILESILGQSEWLVDGSFSVADVAVGSYLNYVPIFFPGANLSKTPNIANYMKRCAERPAFQEAFGAGHSNLVQAKTAEWTTSEPAQEKKIFGMF